MSVNMFLELLFLVLNDGDDGDDGLLQTGHQPQAFWSFSFVNVPLLLLESSLWIIL